jgi:DNA-binding GntR family transcriptional regulator
MANLRLIPTPQDALLGISKNEQVPKKGDLHLHAVAMLRNMIITGALSPGERLNERELCSSLNASRTPVREAIKTLAQDGLIEVSPNRSPVVVPLDAQETADLIVVVSAIEALAGELAASRVTDSEIAELGILHYTMLRHKANDDLPDYFKANKAFHRKILECAQNSTLLWIWDLLSLRVDRARYASNLWPERWRKAMQEHERILKCLSERNPKATSLAMSDHVQNGLSMVVKSLLQAQQSHPKSKRKPLD